jgi:hypothetical protein
VTLFRIFTLSLFSLNDADYMKSKTKNNECRWLAATYLAAVSLAAFLGHVAMIGVIGASLSATSGGGVVRGRLQVIAKLVLARGGVIVDALGVVLLAVFLCTVSSETRTQTEEDGKVAISEGAWHKIVKTLPCNPRRSVRST